MCASDPRRLPCSLAVVAWLVVASQATAEWPTWRGPNGDGVSDRTPLPEQWNDDSLAWRAALGGTGVSSPVVSAGLVIATSQAGRGSRRDGRHPQLARNDPEVARLERALPASGDDVDAFVIEAFDLADGARRWSRRIDAARPLPAVHEKSFRNWYLCCSVVCGVLTLWPTKTPPGKVSAGEFEFSVMLFLK